LLLVAGGIGFETTSFAAEKVFDLRQTVEFALQNNGELKALRDLEARTAAAHGQTPGEA
jgi:hypothetical protein